MSFHIHTGIGDADIVLARCSPALLNETLKQPAYRETKVVLIHTYKYTDRGAPWMAGALPNVWIDLSEGVPFALAAVDRIFETALELAPVNRVLFGTARPSGPEQTWLGAKVAKQALARVLTKLCERGFVTAAEGPEHGRSDPRRQRAGDVRVLGAVAGEKSLASRLSLSPLQFVVVPAEPAASRKRHSEGDRAANIVAGGHFVDGVDVAGRDGQGDGGGTDAGQLHRAGVGAAARQDFELIGDVVRLGDVAQVADKFRGGSMGGSPSP